MSAEQGKGIKKQASIIQHRLQERNNQPLQQWTSRIAVREKKEQKYEVKRNRPCNVKQLIVSILDNFVSHPAKNAD
jgi:hypothetical protein